MSKPTRIPQLQKRYEDAYRVPVTVESMFHDQMTFHRDGYQSLYAQPLVRFVKEFTEVNR